MSPVLNRRETPSVICQVTGEEPGKVDQRHRAEVGGLSLPERLQHIARMPFAPCDRPNTQRTEPGKGQRFGRDQPDPPDRRRIGGVLAALATERDTAAANLTPGLIQTRFGGSLRRIGGSRLVVDERPRQPAKPLVAEDFHDAADLRPLSGQGGEDLDVAAGQQRRPRGVS